MQASPLQVPTRIYFHFAPDTHYLKFLRSYKTILRSSRITAKSCYASETNNVQNLRCFQALLINKRSDFCTNTRILILFSLHQSNNTRATTQSPNNLITAGSKHIVKNNNKKNSKTKTWKPYFYILCSFNSQDKYQQSTFLTGFFSVPSLTV